MARILKGLLTGSCYYRMVDRVQKHEMPLI